MPTYRTDSVTVPGMTVHLLVCEQCGEELGAIAKPVPVTGLSAAQVVLLWPELQAEVARHEDDCPG